MSTRAPAQDRRSIVATLAGELLPELPSLTDRLVDLIRSADGAYSHVSDGSLHDKVRENLAGALADMAAERPARTGPAAETARTRAEQGVPLAAVLHAFRLGFTVIWEAMVERARKCRPDDMADLILAATTVWTVIDEHSEVVTAAYRDALSELARRDEQRRTLLLDAIFEGRVADWTLLNGSARALGLPDDGLFVVVSAETPGAGAEALPQVEQFLRRSGIGSAWRLRADEQVGIVALRRDMPPPALQVLLESVATGRTGMSAEFGDILDTARALGMAVIARRSLPAGTARVVTIADDPFGALVAGNPDLGSGVVGMLLGRLVDLPIEQRRVLLSTLGTWFAAHGSTSEAGRLLYCHRNTVRNRLRRVEDLSGRSLEDPTGIAELYLACVAARLFTLDSAPAGGAAGTASMGLLGAGGPGAAVRAEPAAGEAGGGARGYMK